MNIGNRRAKVLRDSWCAGHGVGVIDVVAPAADIIERLRREYGEAKARLRATAWWGRACA